jgi:hypothetical protein
MWFKTMPFGSIAIEAIEAIVCGRGDYCNYNGT